MPEHKRRKRVLNKFKINELSAVDRPAQAPAKSVILKRADNTMMTLLDKSGHAHLLFEYSDIESGQTSHNGGVKDDHHSHPFVIKNGVVTIGESNGHTHEIDTDDFNSMLFTQAIRENIQRDLELSENAEFKSLDFSKREDWPDDVYMPDGSFPIADTNSLKKAIQVYSHVDNHEEVAQHIARRARALGLELTVHKNDQEISFNQNTATSGGQSLEELDMPNVNATADVAEVQKKLDETTLALTKANDQLAIATELAGMTDVEKGYYNSLKKADQGKFLKASKEDRLAEIENVKKADPVIYKSLDGEEFHKSDDPRLVAMAKRADADRAELEKQRDQNETAQLTKRAETELEFMPGTIETRVSLLKAVETISDEVEKTAVLDSLKAKNASLSKAFGTIGTTEGEATGEPITKSEAVGKLDELAKKLAAEQKIDYLDAYSQVAHENPAIYAKTA